MTKALVTRQGGALSKYDPQKGVKKIAFLDMAEKQWAKARDATKLNQVIEAKLQEQAEFIYWWKTRAKKPEGRPAKTSSRSEASLSQRQLDEDLARHLGTSLSTIRRWTTRLDDPDKFQATLEAACARYVRILHFETTAHVGQNSGDNEWFTPAEIIEPARLVLGDIDLDPASSDAANAIVKAKRFYSDGDDGLMQPWTGRVWMNPPYAQPLIDHFCKKLSASFQAAEVTAAIALVNNATETQWFRELADVAAAVCFPQGRVRFWHPNKASATPLQGQAVLYLGSDLDDFAKQFESLGVVWVKP